MRIKIKESFISIFKEQNWFKKFSLGLFFISLPQLINIWYAGYLVKVQKAQTEMLLSPTGYQILGTALTLKLLAGLLYIVLVGYIIQYTHNKINEIEPSLPEWKNYFKQGLCAFSISLFYALVILIPVLALHLDKQTMSLVVLLLFILLAPFPSFALVLYSKKLKYNDAFDFKNIFSIFKRVIKESYFYSILGFIFILWNVSFDVIRLIPINYLFKVPLILGCGFVELWLSYFVSTNIIVQVYKLSESIKMETFTGNENTTCV